MNKRHRWSRIVGGSRTVAVAAISLVLVSCASARRTALRQVSTASQAAMASGEFDEALELYQRLYEKNRANGKVVSDYASMIEAIKAVGDDACSQGSYAAAQGAYRALAERWDGFSALAPRLTFAKADLEAGVKDCRLAACEHQFRQELGAGNYAKALAAYQAALKDYPGDKGVKARFAKGAAEIAELGAKALAGNDFASGGKIYGLLLKNLDAFEGLTGAAGGGGMSRPELEEALKECSAGLTNSGLVEYRKGNLENAIAIWDGLLAFDPSNAEIKKAVETARAQLGKLKGSTRGGRRSSRTGPGPRETR